ncbi:MAG: hypothetical protein IMY75_12880 [Chloroflexi bacterium]|nr:hypothetical protein [Chloroflexota bacterium]
MRGQGKAKAQFLRIAVFLALVGVLLAGCLPGEDRREIDLDDRASDAELRELTARTDSDVLWFGFDLRASPQEDARQYLPFLEYLTQYYPSSGIAANKDVPPKALDRVRQALLESEGASALPQSKGEIILLVEDNERIRDVGQRLLESLDHRVLTTANGCWTRNAVQKHRNDCQVDCLIFREGDSRQRPQFERVGPRACQVRL